MRQRYVVGMGLLVLSVSTAFAAAGHITPAALQSPGETLKVVSPGCLTAIDTQITTIRADYFSKKTWKKNQHNFFLPLFEPLGIKDSQCVVIRVHISKMIDYKGRFRCDYFSQEVHAFYMYLNKEFCLNLSDDVTTWEGYVAQGNNGFLKYSVIIQVPLSCFVEDMMVDLSTARAE